MVFLVIIAVLQQCLIFLSKVSIIIVVILKSCSYYCIIALAIILMIMKISHNCFQCYEYNTILTGF